MAELPRVRVAHLRSSLARRASSFLSVRCTKFAVAVPEMAGAAFAAAPSSVLLFSLVFSTSSAAFAAVSRRTVLSSTPIALAIARLLASGWGLFYRNQRADPIFVPSSTEQSVLAGNILALHLWMNRAVGYLVLKNVIGKLGDFVQSAPGRW
jgi:predicted neutral ceramidase superfamily lipid hydrolase